MQWRMQAEGCIALQWWSGVYKDPAIIVPVQPRVQVCVKHQDSLVWCHCIINVCLCLHRHGRRLSSVKSVTWRSATNQRSALITTRRMLQAAVDRSILTPGTSARFARRSLHRKAIWKLTCQRFMASVTSRLSNATSAQKSLIKRATWRGTFGVFTRCSRSRIKHFSLFK